MPLKQVVKVAEAVAVLAALVFVVMLFANDGGTDSGGTGSVGQQLFTTNCAGCHGADGGGGLGPKLAGEVTKDFPDIEDQIAFVSAGKGTMPSFGGDLSDEQLRAVVEYTRSLGG
jgi:mono/diheme cytochrome c family protein